MFTRNEGITESDILQNRFTAYILTAIRRRKIQYMQDILKKQQYEESIEISGNKGNLSTNPDMLRDLPFLERIENNELYTALEQAKEHHRYIFFAKVLENRSFVEIGEELGMKPNTAAIIYYRFIKSLKNKLGE